MAFLEKVGGLVLVYVFLFPELYHLVLVSVAEKMVPTVLVSSSHLVPGSSCFFLCLARKEASSAIW